MRSLATAILFILAAISFAIGQQPSPESAPGESATAVTGPGIQNLPIQRKAPDPDSVPPGVAQTNGYVRPDAETRRKRYIKSLIGPISLGTTVAKAGYSTWRNSPEEWGPGWEGFGRRVASSLGKKLIKQTTIYGLDEALKIDSQFYRSEKKDTGSKIKNALISPVTARRPNGKRVFGVSRIAGTYASSIISAETWYPDRYSWKNGVRSGTISLGFNAAFNLFKEFVWKK